MTDAPVINTAEARRRADVLASGLPALLARARHLAATLSIGSHGRRRAGMGEEFWQYRSAVHGDAVRDIDWRRSARSDGQFVRQMEWQTAQSVTFWVDPGAAMDFGSGSETKADRAKVLALAMASLLSKGGERFGLMQDPEPAKTGESQLTKIALAMTTAGEVPDYATPPQKLLPKGSRAIFFSDFLGDWDQMVAALSLAADQDVQGALVQIVDPQEADFPFHGRTVFESMKGTLNFESLRASSLRDEYLEKMAERQDALQALAARTGWQYLRHQTDGSAQSALLWLYSVIEGQK